MRIGVFADTNKKLAIVLCQLPPDDCPYDEENYPGIDPSERIQEIENSGYKVLTVWWKDIKHDPNLFIGIMANFDKENRSFGMH